MPVDNKYASLRHSFSSLPVGSTLSVLLTIREMTHYACKAHASYYVAAVHCESLSHHSADTQQRNGGAIDIASASEIKALV